MALTQGTDIAQLTADQIRELQNILMRAGYNPGPIDGILGNQTRNAYNRFLIANGYGNEESSYIIRPIDLMSKNTGDVWQTVTLGTDSGTPAAPIAPAQAVAPASAPGVPTSAPNAPAAAPVAAASPAATEETVRQKYPHLSYLLDNPEVKDVLLRATQGGWDAATLQGELWKTSYWQTTSNVTRLWDQKFAQDNATALLEWDQRAVAVGNLVGQMGFNLPDNDVKWIAGRVLREGWSDDQLKRFLGSLARQSGIGPGQVTEQAAQLKMLAKNYMSTMQDSQAMEYAIRISEGSLTREAAESMLRQEAKARFSWLAPQIDAGLSPMDLFGSTRNAVAQELEIDPNQIDFTNVKWSALTNPVKSEDGSLRSMNFHEAQRWARQQAEWRFTDGANKQAADLELNILQALGVRK